MRSLNCLALVTIATLAMACGRSRSPAVDDALKNDLALAAQAQGFNPQFNPAEAGYAPQSQYASPYAGATAPRTIQASASRPVSTRRASSSSTRRSSGSSSSRSSGGYYPAPAPRTTVEKHTGRDAAIGAAAGAILGATASRDKIKGGLIGAAAGGILGAVIGNNVDVHRKTGW
jgi:Rickettsia 17 kDa surface antigen.